MGCLNIELPQVVERLDDAGPTRLEEIDPSPFRIEGIVAVDLEVGEPGLRVRRVRASFRVKGRSRLQYSTWRTNLLLRSFQRETSCTL